jgi:hypothetical protein
MAQQALAQIVGIKALMKDIDKQCKDERSALFSAMKKAGYAAVAPVVPATRAALPHSDRKDTHWHKSGALSSSVRASAYRSGAAVRMGSKSQPQAGWVEFGGTRRRPHLSERPFVKSGQYLFPAARGDASRAATEYTKAVNEVFGRAAVWTNAKQNPEAIHD